MLVLYGQSATKKSKLKEHLSDLGLTPATCYTTRPLRKKNPTCQYISQDEFTRKKEANFFAGFTSYFTPSGTWSYGIKKEDTGINSVAILGPYDITVLREQGIPVFVVKLISSDDSIATRLIKRNWSVAELESRLKQDDIDALAGPIDVDMTVVTDEYVPIDGVAKIIYDSYQNFLEFSV